MYFYQLMTDILVYVPCKFEMYIFKIAQVICENEPIAFLYVLSLFLFHYASRPMQYTANFDCCKWHFQTKKM